MRKPWVLVGVAAAFAVAAVTITLVIRDRDGRPEYESLTAEEILDRVQRAISRKGSYRVAVTGHNLVLPQWGGIESGTVDVKLDGPAASASLQRTGDGLYKMMLADAQTFFQRSTCDSFTRVPGGGADVLAPFVLADISLVNRDSGIRIDDYLSPPVILVQTARLGHVALEFDPESYLPVRLRKVRDAASASESEWQFSDWGEPVSVDAPSGDIADNGPGGNPC